MARNNNKGMRDKRSNRKAKKLKNGWSDKILAELQRLKEGNNNGTNNKGD